ncbi:MAG: hypothetical protein AMXMBFR36_04100 [Acidobacteriota bacterium]
MEGFLRSVPAAASSPFAFSAYAIAALLFLLAGAKLRTTKLLLSRIADIPEVERRRALEIATGTILPERISPEQWIRHSRQRWIFTICGGLLIALVAVAAVAIVNPTQAELGRIEDTAKESANETQAAVRQGTQATVDRIDESTNQILTTVEDAALASLETMFPLAVRREGDVDGTIVHLDGRPRQRIVSFDGNNSPMKLYWGDRFHYFAFSERNGLAVPSTSLILELKTSGATQLLPLPLGTATEQSLRIPGSSPEPMDAFVINEGGLSGIALKITIYSSDRERGREEFRRALMNTALNNAARRVYFEVGEDGVRLRSTPEPDGSILRTLRQGTYVRVKEASKDLKWSLVRLPEGREGWIASRYLAPIAQ